MKTKENVFLDVTRNEDTPYSFEMFVDIGRANGEYVRPVAIIRPVYISADDVPEADKEKYHLWEGGVNALVKERFEILMSDLNDDFEVVETIYKDGLGHYDWQSCVALREKPERGMCPVRSLAGDNANELCYIPIYDGYGLCAVENADNKEIYIGITHGFEWWQNLCRFRLSDTKAEVLPEVFMEWTRGYDNRCKSIPLEQGD